MSGRPWTKTQLAILRAGYNKKPVEDLARRLGRSIIAVRQSAGVHGVARKRCPTGKRLDAFTRTNHLRGWCDPHIASAWHAKFPGTARVDRHTVSFSRRRLGLAVNAQMKCPLCRERTRQNTKRQCREAGVSSLAQIRALAFRAYARRHGWPEDLRPRQVQILDALATNGPMTKIQIAQAIGMPWENRPSRDILTGCDKDPGGGLLPNLMRRRLVIALGRTYRTRHRWEQTYSLALATQRSFA
jgi:hypothetical protein